jgi:HSP20 family protein
MGGRMMKLHSELKWEPSTDVVVTEGEIMVRVEIAGMKSGDFDVVTDGKVLNISGYRRSDYPSGKKQFHTIEIQAGPFEKVLELPVPVDHSKVTARYRNGMLEITIARIRPPKRTRKVPIK